MATAFGCSLLMQETEHWKWAYSEFGHSQIPDLRNVKRLVAMCATAAAVRGGTLTEVFADRSKRDAAYDFLENNRISPVALGHAAAVASARRSACEPFVFIAVDGTSLTLPDSHGTKGMGRLGSDNNSGKGIKIITSLVVNPSGIPLGVGEFTWWTRTGKPNKSGSKARVPNGKRAVKEKETQRWVDTIDGTRSTFVQHAPYVRRWWVIDREADSITLLHKANEQGDWFTIRSNVNRRLVRDADELQTVRDVLSAQTVVNMFEMQVPAGHNRSKRQATIHVSHARVTLDMRENWSKERHPLTVNAVLLREVGTNPPDEAPITWLLYTNHPVDAPEDLHLVIFSYMQRWRIEDFHRTWKKGACRVEDTRLGKVDNVIRWATILATVAARTERLKILARVDPALPANAEFSTYELKAICALKRDGSAEPENLTVGQAVLYVAEIGGYTGKSSGGPPGSVTIGRGLERVNFIAMGMKLAEANQAPTSQLSKRKRR